MWLQCSRRCTQRPPPAHKPFSCPLVQQGNRLEQQDGVLAEQLCRQGWGTARRTEDRSTGTWHSPASCPLGFPLLPGKLILTGSTVHQEHLMHVTLMLLELEAGVWALQCTSVPFERNGSVCVKLDSGGKDFAVRCNQVFIIHIEF